MLFLVGESSPGGYTPSTGDGGRSPLKSNTAFTGELGEKLSLLSTRTFLRVESDESIEPIKPDLDIGFYRVLELAILGNDPAHGDII